MLKDNLIALRNINGYSQEKIAEKIGISRQAYAKWESGETVPDVIKCRLLAEIYGVTLDSMLDTENLDGIGIVPPSPKGKHIYGTVAMNDHGQIVIPKAARDQFGLTSGDRLVVLGDDAEGIALIPAVMFEERINKMSEMLNSRE